MLAKYNGLVLSIMKVFKISTRWFCIGLLALTPFLFYCKRISSVKKTLPGKIKTIAPPFVHPGILNTKASLDFIASEIKAGNAERVASFQKVVDFINVPNKYPVSFPSVVVVGSNGATTPSKKQIRSDSELAYAIALRWAATGDTMYARQAIDILNGWASAFQSYGLLDNPSKPTNANQPSLEASWTTPTFVAAAEILRYYKVNGRGAGWTSAAIKQFEGYLGKVKIYIDKTPVYNNNWNVSAGYAKMSIGIFLDNRTIYQNGVDDIKKYLPVVISPDGTIDELCKRKDCVHFQYSLTGFTYAAELAKIQGDGSIYTDGSSRISLGYDFMRKAYDRTTGCDYCSLSSPVFPGVEVAYNNYNTETLKSLREIKSPNGLPNDYTFLGFTTYTHYRIKLN